MRMERPSERFGHGPWVATLVVLALVSSPGLRAARATSGEWPQFRGPATSGVSAAPGLFEHPVGVGLQVASTGQIYR